MRRSGKASRGSSTSRAAQKLAEAGIESSTLQRHLARSNEPPDRHKSFYVLDESSLTSTRQMNQFLHRLKHTDRVLLVGDVRQHQAVEAGTPYQHLQEAGIQTAHLDEIVRQNDPALKEVVEQLSHGQVREAVENLDAQSRVHEVLSREKRFGEIAREYARQPEASTFRLYAPASTCPRACISASVAWFRWGFQARREVLRGPTSRSTDQTAEVESCQASISSRPTSCSLNVGVSGEYLNLYLSRKYLHSRSFQTTLDTPYNIV